MSAGGTSPSGAAGSLPACCCCPGEGGICVCLPPASKLCRPRTETRFSVYNGIPLHGSYPAGEAGLKAGDRLVKFNGRSVYGLDGLRRFIDKVTGGETVEVLVQRKGGEKVTLKIKAGEGL